MKKRTLLTIWLLLITLLVGMATPVSAASDKRYALPEETTLHASSAIVVSLGATAEEDSILFELAADDVRAPGAMVRIAVGMTALKLIEEQELNIESDTGVYTEEARIAIGASGLATVGMNVGEEWTLEDLLAISMLTTAADAAQTLAVTLCETDRDFSTAMNEWAQSIGCTDTHFIGVHGLDNASQTTTARDMYRILRAAVGNRYMETWLSQTKYTVNPVANGKQRTYSTVNELLRPSSEEYYEALAIGRSGYTSRAGRCMASVARSSGYEYLVVVMGCPQTVEDIADGTSHYVDTRTLYRWVFRNFSYQAIIGRNDPITRAKVNYAWATDSVTMVAAKNLSLVVPDGTDMSNLKRVVDLPESLNAPIQKGEQYGVVRLYNDEDVLVGEVGIVAAENVKRSLPVYCWEQIKALVRSPWFYGGAALLGLLIVGYVMLNIYHNYQRRNTGNKRVKFK